VAAVVDQTMAVRDKVEILLILLVDQAAVEHKEEQHHLTVALAELTATPVELLVPSIGVVAVAVLVNLHKMHPVHQHQLLITTM
tara:strand:+ start:219 stop:470 length:252 start_codon:yes stop_codon:yes gene_type:complete